MRCLNFALLSSLAAVSFIARAEDRSPSTGMPSLGISIDPAASLRTRPFLVDQTADSLSGNCQDGVTGQCNLRAAVNAAELAGGTVNIILAVDSIIDQGQIVIAASAPGKDFDLTIKGQGEMQNITSAGYTRLFQVDKEAKLNLENLVISKFAAIDGGAILNYGTMTIKGTVFRENKSTCVSTGAMTAYTTCSGGAFLNAGKITLGDGTLFEDNESSAMASTASFTTSSTSGGAITSSGTIILDGVVAFHHNAAIAAARSGYHPMPAGGASASASGGAIANFGGSVEVTDAGKGKCLFLQNEATADASTPFGAATLLSVGGAIASTGGTLQGLPSDCTFQGNSAITGADTNFVP